MCLFNVGETAILKRSSVCSYLPRCANILQILSLHYKTVKDIRDKKNVTKSEQNMQIMATT